MSVGLLSVSYNLELSLGVLFIMLKYRIIFPLFYRVDSPSLGWGHGDISAPWYPSDPSNNVVASIVLNLYLTIF